MVNKIANNDEVGDRLGYAYPKERKDMKSASDTAGKEKKEDKGNSKLKADKKIDSKKS